MTISVAQPIDCVGLTLSGLHLDLAGVDLLSYEALAESLRRAAAFQCPTTSRRLVDAVVEAVQPLCRTVSIDRQDVADLVEMLVSAGDLIELPPDAERRGRHLYLAPPSYVEQRPGRYLLVGIRPFGAPLLGSDLDRSIDYKRHVRSIELEAGEGNAFLESLGLHQIAVDRWASAPAKELPAEFVANARGRLDAAGNAGHVAGLYVLDPSTSLGFYKGRWRQLRADDSGDFVARRSQEYGADLWCFVRIAAGSPERLTDFPTGDPTVPGRDEAWRLQAAIDATRECHQLYRAVPSSSDPELVYLDFFAPVPTWAERYLQLVGIAVSERRRCLFSYLIPEAVMQNVSDYLSEMLWMRKAQAEGAM